MLTDAHRCRAGSTYLAYAASAFLKANDVESALQANALLLGLPPSSAYVTANQPFFIAEPLTGKALSFLPPEHPGRCHCFTFALVVLKSC